MWEDIFHAARITASRHSLAICELHYRRNYTLVKQPILFMSYFTGLVKNILEAKFWIPLSRINYAAFIIHKDVISVFVYNIESPVHFTALTLVRVDYTKS